MKKFIPLLAASLLLAGNAIASGVWAPQPSTGGGSGECYLVTFNAGTSGTRMLMGNGIVSGSSYKGFLRAAQNPSYSGTSRVSDCGANGQCAWDQATMINPHHGLGNSSVLVSGLPVISAQPVACF